MSPVVAPRRFSSVRILSFLFANLIWAVPLFLAPAVNASAQDTFTVSVTSDDSGVSLATAQGNCPANNPGGSASCSLRDAMTAASADANSAIVDLTGVTGTITATSNLPQVFAAPTANTIAFNGPGASALTVSGANAFQLFVFLNGSASFQNFTVANGFVNATGGCTCDPGYGAGIYAYSNVPLTLTNMVITGNVAANGAGGVLAGGSLSVTGTTFSNNISPSSGGGIAGALYAIGSPATVYQSTFLGNSAWIGSAIYTYTPVTLTISDSTFANNSNGSEGVVGGSGAVFNDNGSTLIIHDSTFWNNVAAAGLGGALNNAGTMTVTDSIVGNPGDSSGTGECYSANTTNGAGCPSNGDANGNVTAPATFNLGPLGFNGGPTETLVPQSGSAAVCGGTTAGALDAAGAALTVDQRGFGLDQSCATGTTDAGAVQTNFLKVTSSADTDGATCGATCTLRQAMNVANTQGNGDITIDSSLNGATLSLTAILPEIEGSIDVSGPTGAFTIDGGGKYQAFWVDGGSSLSISNLTIQNASTATTASGAFAQGYGGAIYNASTLSVANSSFLNNTAGSATGGGQANPSEGGAILNTGTLTVTNSTFSGNTASNTPTYGGSGGAITSSGPLTISDSTFATNTANDGGAIYLVSNPQTTIDYSTFSGNTTNTATFSGALYNQGILTVQNSTFAANVNGGIHSSGSTLSVTNSIFAETSECDPSQSADCPSSGFGNDYATAPVSLAALGNYGGPTPTMLPQPGSSAICSGLSADIPTGISQDQRGFSNQNNTYTGVTLPCVDAGSAQTNYTSAQFVAPAGPYAGSINIAGTTPPVIVSVTENGQNVGGVTVPLVFAGTGTATGTSATTVAGTGATFNLLSVDATGTDTLSVNLTVVGTDALTAGPETLNVNPAGTTTTTTTEAVPSPNAFVTTATATPVTLSATVTSTATVNEGYVAFTVHSGSATGPVIGNAVGPIAVNSGATGNVTYTIPASEPAATYYVVAAYTDPGGSLASSSDTSKTIVIDPTVTATQAIATTTLTENHAPTPFTPVTGSGGIAPLSYTVSPALPASLTMASASGQISGTPTVASATATYTVTVKDADNNTATATFSLTVNTAVTATTAVASTVLTQGHAATAFTPVTGRGGTGTLGYGVSPALPSGLIFNAVTGEITGTPSASSPLTSYTVTVTDANGATATATFNLTVNGPLAATQSVAAVAFTINHPITAVTPVTGSGGTSPLTYGVAPALPAGLLYSTSTGQITGTPTAVHATSTFTVTVTDANNATATSTFTLTVNAAVTATTAVATTTLTQNHAATAFTPVTGGGGTTPLSYGVSPALPTGLLYSTSTGQITGTPTVTLATTTFTVTVTDADGATATATFGLTVNGTVAATTAVPAITLTVNHAATAVTPVTGSGGTAPLTYSVSPTLPAGLTMASGTGQITGTPTVTSTATTYTVTVTDANSATGTATFSLTVNGAVAATTAVPATILTENHAATFTPVTGSGGTTPLSYSVSPTLPAGLTMASGTGQITGTPTVTLSATTFTVTVTDANSATGTATFSLTVNAAVTATTAVAATTLTQNHAAIAFTPVTGAGGTTPLSYSVSPALPTGLAMASGTGQITGTPTVALATTTFTVTVTDANSATGTATFSLTVNGAIAATTAVPTTVLTENHAAAPFTPVTGAGGTTPLSYSVLPALPTGLSMASGTGQITGTPTVTLSATTFTVTVTDANSATATATFSLAVNGAVSATTAVPTTVLTENHAATAFTPVTGAGGTAPLSYGVSPALPTGLTMASATGQISGTPTVALSATTFTVTVTDANNATATATFSLTVNSSLSATTAVATTTLTENHAATAFTPVTAAGGTAPLNFTVSPTLPAGLTMASATGQITGTPTVVTTTTTYTVTVKDANNATATATFSLSVSTGLTAQTSVPTIGLTINHAAAPVTPVTGAGGTAPLSYSVSPTLPAGLAMASATGQITGTPTVTSAATTYTVTVTDANSTTATSTFSLTVNGAVAATTAVPSTVLTENHAATAFAPVTGSGGTTPLSYGVSPALPAGLTMASATGQISGTPTVASAATTYTVTVTDANSATATATFSLTVNGSVSATTAVATTILTENHAATAFMPVTGAGGTAPLTYAVSPALPAGLTMAAATGQIAGTPTVASAATTYTVTVTDAVNATATATFSLTVNGSLTATTAVPSTTLLASQLATPFTPVTGAGGTAPLTYSVSPALPAGLTMASATGQISGTPTVTSTAATYTVTVTDANSTTATATFSLTVNSAGISIAWANPAPITYGTSLAGVLNATVTYQGSAVPGTFVYTATPTGGAAATVTAATIPAVGNYTLTANFTPTDTTKYSTPPAATVSLTVNQAQPTLTWTPATSISYGTSLSALLNATATFGGNTVAGAYVYTATPTGGATATVTAATILPQGSYTLAVSFTPTDATDYKTANGTSPLTVTGQTLTVSANNATRVYGTANPTLTGSVTGAVNGDTFTETFSTTATATSNVGNYPIVPSATGANLSDYTVVIDNGTLSITQAGTTTTLTASSNTINPGASVTLTATVASATTGTPTGTVSFYDGATLLGAGTLAAGASGDVATFSTTTLASGSHTITAIYNGDTNFSASSTTGSIAVSVASLGLTISANPASQTGNPGTTFTYQLAVAPAFAGTPYPAAVTFAAKGGPDGAVITFSPTSLAANAGPQTVSMAVATSASHAAVQPLSTGRKFVPVAFALLLLPLAGTRRMRRNGKKFGQFLGLLLLALAGIAATTALSGCGTSPGGSTTTGSGTQYTITVTATSGSVSQNTTVTVTLL
ncbi:MAG TPA: putative Ig domain-containing protein [Acidobacteriaceae bacterium]